MAERPTLPTNYANLHGWTDIVPFEVVNWKTHFTIEVREMDAKKGNWKPDFHAGGFFGHVSNQSKQEYEYSPNPNNPIIKARLHKKDGYYHSSLGKHIPCHSPRKFYDFNF